MLKKFIAHWQYGIKARVVDGALVAKICTATTPTSVRINLNSLNNATLALQNVGADYDLVFQQAVSNGGNITVAKFTNREAAEVARCGITCALYRGTRVCSVKKAFGITIGVVLALMVSSLFYVAIGHMFGGGKSNAEMAMSMMAPTAATAPMTLAPEAAPEAASRGVPMSADDYLKQ